ncbi:MAG TPA: hypothetical protein VNS09_05790 [Solirubrobacter sp.]|nr:hypothetical protein [Solirubrobacter sp.]
MRKFTLAAVVAALLVPAAPAFAGDPTMPLSQVQAGMHCTGYSVIQGTAISAFDVDVLDVTAGEAASVGSILVRVSGPAVDATGVGPGFSGSPIYCPDGAGTERVIGAISEVIGEYGGKTVLATPIDAILGTPVDVPARRSSPSRSAKTRAKKSGASSAGATPSGAAASRTAAASPRMKAALAAAKPIAMPITVSGLSTPLANALTAAAAKRNQPVLAVPPGPLATFAPQTLRPGSAVAIGYSNGDVRTSSTGTVAYVDGDRVWVFGHSLEGVGRRALLLQDAYVFGVINNPFQLGSLSGTYKLASSGHDLGTISNDAYSAVVGRTGALPHTVPVTAIARDEDSGRSTTVATQAADEAAVDLPSGGSWTSFIAPLAVTQSATGVLGSSPGRLTGELCARIGLAGVKRPLRFCNRYVSAGPTQGDDGGISNAVFSGVATDIGTALGMIDGYIGKPPVVTGVNALLKLHRGADQAFMRSVSLPRTVRPGQRVRVRVSLQRVRGARLTRSYTITIPRDARRGTQRLRFVGQDADQGDNAITTIILGGDDDRDEGGDPGPASLDELAEGVRAIARYDGVTLRLGRTRAQAFRDKAFRISGQAETSVTVR